MHYYSHNIGDYRRDTGHLTMLEHGAYRQLLDTYYLSEKPLTLNHADLMRTHCARTADEVLAVENVLKDFFVATEGGYVHKRCDVEIEAFHAKSTSASESAKARWARVRAEKEAKAMRTHSEGNANHKPITNNQEPITKDKKTSSSGDDWALKFEQFWKLYPNKKAKQGAVKAWAKLKPDQQLYEKIMSGLGKWVASPDWKKDGGQFIPHPATWLNGRRWEDEVAIANASPSRHHGFEQRDYFEGLTQREDGTYAI